MNQKMMIKVLAGIKSALVNLDNRVKELEITTDRDMGDIDQELDQIQSTIELLETIGEE